GADRHEARRRAEAEGTRTAAMARRLGQRAHAVAFCALDGTRATAVIRSFLFTPANVPRRVEKALTLSADAVILDLEDSVAPADKVPSRRAIVDALAKPRQALLYVRVNAPSTPWCFRDLVETVRQGLDGIVVPKIESAADLHAIDWLMANLEREHGFEEGRLDLMPQIETAAGVQRVDRILQARSLRPYRAPWRVKRVCFGAADYAND